MELPPEGFELVNQGRIFTPFADEPVVLKPNFLGGANWPPSSYDPTTGLYYVCASDKAGVFVGGESFDAEPTAGRLFFGGQSGSLAFPRFGVFAAMDVTTNRIAWIKYAGQETQNLSLDDRVDSRRGLVCHEQRRVPRQRPPAVGVPDRGRSQLDGERLRARGYAVRRLLCGRQPLRELTAG